MADSANADLRRSRLRTRGGDFGLKVVLRLCVLVVLLVAWQLLGDDTAKFRLPTVTRTLSSLWTLTVDGSLPIALLVSNLAMIIGYAAAVIVGVSLGVAMGTLRTFGHVSRPYLLIIMVIPLIAILPVIQAVLGLGLVTRAVVVFLFAVVYIALNTETGLLGVPRPLVEMARSYGSSPWRTFREVMIPSARPDIIAGLRLGLGRAVVGMVIAELFLVSPGIGSLLSLYRGRFDTGAVLAIVLVLILEGVLIMQLTSRFEPKRKSRS
ncbi:ABC transporter permease [Compostimonas suwonensis]|uniref:NitT/TauT family transport system permease protein n=1 Tax=Compostimonas suwonensis TaxID=1048394 RepID=A0A2M9BZX8_9MICO|nr:ABC transporter permease subunit [Compostimonas suwonensis]PJJ63610.1 NitT/TauT family transport system permease protein [Compostimonas suwonensis]